MACGSLLFRFEGNDVKSELEINSFFSLSLSHSKFLSLSIFLSADVKSRSGIPVSHKRTDFPTAGLRSQPQSSLLQPDMKRNLTEKKCTKNEKKEEKKRAMDFLIRPLLRFLVSAAQPFLCARRTPCNYSTTTTGPACNKRALFWDSL